MIVDVNLLLIESGKVLLGRRRNTGYEDGKFHLPAGHVEAGETAVGALLREAREELGITIDPEQIRFSFLLDDSSDQGRLRLFFSAAKWIGSIQNLEPEKCELLEWFNLNDLPANLVAHVRYVIERSVAGEVFGRYARETSVHPT